MLIDRLPTSASLANVTHLAFYGKKITDDTLAELSTHSQLAEIHLIETAITAEGFAMVRKLVNLNWLDLDCSRGIAGESLLHILSLSKLTGLSLEGLSGVASILPRLDELSQLEYLNLGKTDLDDRSLALLPTMPKLRTLRLDDTAVSTEGVLALKKLPSLVTLGLRGTPVPESALDQLKKVFTNCDIAVTYWTSHPFAQLRQFLLGVEEFKEIRKVSLDDVS